MRKRLIFIALAVAMGMMPLTALSQLSLSYYSSSLSKIGMDLIVQASWGIRYRFLR